LTGRSASAEVVVEVRTATKSGQYQHDETDLSTSLDGVPINLVRAYDSLAAGRSGSFGFGWRLANRDFDLQTSVPPTGFEDRGTYAPFRLDTRVYMTLPDGQRVGFSFTPQRHALPGLVYYTRAWQADAGVAWKLDS